jgi:hypothetical protein
MKVGFVYMFEGVGDCRILVTTCEFFGFGCEVEQAKM